MATPYTDGMLPIGVMLNSVDRNLFAALPEARRLGFEVIHTAALPERLLQEPERSRVIQAIRDSGLRVDSMFVGFDGQSYADLPSIKRTVGLVQPELREHRLETARRYIGIASEVGSPSLSLHLGFLPADRSHPDYIGTAAAVRSLCDECSQHGLEVRLETGQESPENLLAFLEAVNRPNLGVNFDPGNFRIYDTADPATAFETLAPRVRGFHCKDGQRPVAPGLLGCETTPGKGEADLAGLLTRLVNLGFSGPLIIEREQREDGGDLLRVRDFIKANLERPA